MAAEVFHFPPPLTHDWAEIQAGRVRALEAYVNARTPAEKGRALHWINHWRVLQEHASALRQIGLI